MKMVHWFSSHVSDKLQILNDLELKSIEFGICWGGEGIETSGTEISEEVMGNVHLKLPNIVYQCLGYNLRREFGGQVNETTLLLVVFAMLQDAFHTDQLLHEFAEQFWTAPADGCRQLGRSDGGQRDKHCG